MKTPDRIPSLQDKKVVVLVTKLGRLVCDVSYTSQLQLIYDRQSAAHLGPVTNFSFSLKFLLDSCGFVILWRNPRGTGFVHFC
jgi:hypothetical protein